MITMKVILLNFMGGDDEDLLLLLSYVGGGL